MSRRIGWAVATAWLAMGLLSGGCGDDDDVGPVCGDDVAEGAEQCDGADLGGATCAELGHTGGTLACTGQCVFDESGCFDFECGDGTVEGTEQCDGDDLDGADCEDLGWQAGTLACNTAECTYDDSGCYNHCGNGTIDAGDGEVCDNSDLGGEACTDQGFDGGALACASDCSGYVTTGCCDDTCPAEDDTECVGDTLRTCTLLTSGCLAWDEVDCTATGDVCDASGSPAACVVPCSDAAECVGASAGDGQCVGNEPWTCQDTNADGCLEWTAGGACDPDLCDDASGAPACVPNGGGDSCVDVQVVLGNTSLTGSDFGADYSDAEAFTGTGCVATSATGTPPEAVFAVELSAGETVTLSEHTSSDFVLGIIATCDATAACLDSRDLSEHLGVTYVAAGDETVYLWISTWSGSTINVAYDIQITITPPEMDCGDGVDNDNDGLTDCADSDCFGDPTHCATELDCGDGLDNDADNLTDCADPDCVGVGFCEATEITCDDGEDNDGDGDADCDDADCTADPNCVATAGLWEQFSGSSLVDLEECSLTFTPAAGDPNGYTQTYDCSSLGGAFPVAPGSGTVSVALTLGDDASVEHTLSVLSAVELFGVPYTSFWVGSNGFVTFGAGDNTRNSSASTFFAYPRIAGLDNDLDPPSGGTITVDELADRAVVTFDQVPRYTTGELHSFQIVMWDTGVVEIHYLLLEDGNDGIAGLSNGGPNGNPPAQTDFVPPPAPKINEIAYDDDGADDAEFVELQGTGGMDLTGYTLVHHNGNGGTVTWALDLTGVTMPADGFFVFGSPNVPNVDLDWDVAQTAGSFTGSKALQNDAESVVLYTGWDGATGTIVDAVEYESGATPSFAETAPSVGVTLGSWNTSIGRYPDGHDTDDNLADVPALAWPTPGAPNAAPDPGAPWIRVTASSQSAEAGTFPLSIPDNDVTGITSTIDTTGYAWFTPAVISDLLVGVRILHPYQGDVHAVLSAPDGMTSVMLHGGTGGSGDNVEGIYDLYLTPDTGSMDDFTGVIAQGAWSLTLWDDGFGDAGTLVEWVLWAQ